MRRIVSIALILLMAFSMPIDSFAENEQGDVTKVDEIQNEDIKNTADNENKLNEVEEVDNSDIEDSIIEQNNSDSIIEQNNSDSIIEQNDSDSIIEQNDSETDNNKNLQNTEENKQPEPSEDSVPKNSENENNEKEDSIIVDQEENNLNPDIVQSSTIGEEAITAENATNQSVANNQYTVSVPSIMEPGETAEIIISGSTENTLTFNVTVPDFVTLSNNIDSTTTDLSIYFDGLSESVVSGDFSISGNISLEDTNILFGTWTGVFTIDVESTIVN